MRGVNFLGRRKIWQKVTEQELLWHAPNVNRETTTITKIKRTIPTESRSANIARSAKNTPFIKRRSNIGDADFLQRAGKVLARAFSYNENEQVVFDRR